MIRSKKKFNVDLIISGDWHLRENTPKCRTDNFWEAQWDKVNQVFELQKKYNCDLYLSGDLFHHWKTSPYLINETMKQFPKPSTKTRPRNKIHSIIGNHDMPGHNIDNMGKSGLTTLYKSGIVRKLSFQGDWGFEKESIHPIHVLCGKLRKMVFLHIMTYKGNSPWPGCTDPECNELFDWFPDTELIITGHNHKPFTAKKGKQVLVNPGSLTRQTADQINHKPCVFLYDSKLHKLKKHYLKIKENVISTDHLKIQKAKDKRINAFIEKLKTKWNSGLSFEQNMEVGIRKNKISKRIQDIIYEWTEK